MSDATPESKIEIVFGALCRGNWPVSLVYDGKVLLAKRVDPYDSGKIDAFVAAAQELVPSLDPEEIRDGILQRATLSAQQPAPATEDKEPDHEAMLNDIPDSCRDQAEEMLNDPNLLRRVVDDIHRLGVAGEKKLAATVYLIGVSRRLAKPLAGRIHGHTSTGKSFVTEQVSKLFPADSIIHANQMTPQALFHMKPGSLTHRWVVCGERSRLENDEAAEATRALREMLAAGRLSKLMPVKIGGAIETVLIEQEGPIAFTESSTQSRIFGEDANRCLNLTSDERQEQTRRILRAAASEAFAPNDRDELILRHHAMQHLIAMMPAHVLIPYAEPLAESFPSERPEARRAFGQVLSMIKAVTLLHHRQRDENEDGGFIADVDDYRIARFLLDGPMCRAIGGGVSDSARRLCDQLRSWFPAASFSSTQVYSRVNFSDHAVRGWLSELTHMGVLEIIEQGGRGKAYTYRFAHIGPPGVDANPLMASQLSFLPPAENVMNW